MASLTVLDPGFLTTVQDLGRQGYQQFGVPVGGAMDTYSLRAGNRLVGNEDHLAALEVTLQGPRLKVRGETVMAVTGAKLKVFKNGQRVPQWEALYLGEGDELSLGEVERGARAYLCVAGGLDVPLLLGSRSTFLGGGWGGFHGRVLRARDVLPLVAATRERLKTVGNFALQEDQSVLPVAVTPIRVMLGPQSSLFPAATLETLCAGSYQISHQADRMGYRLAGEVLVSSGMADVISDGIAPGSIQVAGNGQPTIMLADRQTTGGYAKIATVIGADLSLLGQMKPQDRVQFVAVNYEAAVQALVNSEDKLARLPRRPAPSRIFQVLLQGSRVRAEVSEI
ncbi:MAG: biotin-dependent carboxyltransferase family protein [Thermaerobacter sp.]|nr:biotin-dependent carboxyltransferase family protein [Thermaerobacter sp.]